MVVIDKLSKFAHFIPVKSTYKVINISEIFMEEIFSLHGIPKMVISNRDVKFTSNFWKELFAGSGINLNFSTIYHLETDGKIERMNQIIKEILRMYVRKKPTKWEEYLHLFELTYKNGYQASSKMSPFEVSYGRKCTTPINWDNLVDRIMVGPKILQEMERMVKMVQ
jgi:transposase InsO family protein